MENCENKKIYVINVDDIPDEWEKCADELTDEEFKEVSNGWHFDTIEEFIEAFNMDSNLAPCPDTHCLRLI